MTAGRLLLARRIAERFPCERYRTLCDICPFRWLWSTRISTALALICPDCEPAYERYVRDIGLSLRRLQFRSGNFFNEHSRAPT
jgi:hypothetical protein